MDFQVHGFCNSSPNWCSGICPNSGSSSNCVFSSDSIYNLCILIGDLTKTAHVVFPSVYHYAAFHLISDILFHRLNCTLLKEKKINMFPRKSTWTFVPQKVPHWEPWPLLGWRVIITKCGGSHWCLTSGKVYPCSCCLATCKCYLGEGEGIQWI